MRVLVTGGAGFIGSFVTDRLVERGHRVRVLDGSDRNLRSDRSERSDRSASPGATERVGLERVTGDVRDRSAVDRALDGIDAVVHLAAVIGVDHSMARPSEYASTNTLGTAVLLEAVHQAREKSGQPSRMVVASSMSVYGEGMYRCDRCGPCRPEQRPLDRLQAGDWEVRCPGCGSPAPTPVPIQEDLPLRPASVYGITKRDQEEMCLQVGRWMGLRVAALRFFNVYGPRQALSNPYTGVLACFAAQILSGRAPTVFEDGRQVRDFVYVTDAAEAVVRVLELLGSQAQSLVGRAFNVGSNRPTTVGELAEMLVRELSGVQPPNYSGRFRLGDARHAWADTSALEAAAGFRPAVSLEEGIRNWAQWLRSRPPEQLQAELARFAAERGRAGELRVLVG